MPLMCTNPWVAAITLVVGLGAMAACSDDQKADNGGVQPDGGAGAGGADAGGGAGGGDAGADAPMVTLPVKANELVSGQFAQSEGIAFNGEGRLFVVADTDLWEVKPDGSTSMVADLTNPVGLASRGKDEILVAEFGDKTFTKDGMNDDGSVLSVTPDGTVTTIATGIGDPNFIHVRKDGTLLVSDDFTDKIYEVATDGTVSTFLQGIQSPNGMVESLDGNDLFVAQTFTMLDPLTFDDRLWRVPLTSGAPGTPVELGATGGAGANDGVAMDAQGRIYVAENVGASVWRFDPKTGDKELVVDMVGGVASLAFGEGDFNATSIYATNLFGGKVWEIPIDVAGAPVNR